MSCELHMSFCGVTTVTAHESSEDAAEHLAMTGLDLIDEFDVVFEQGAEYEIPKISHT